MTIAPGGASPQSGIKISMRVLFAAFFLASYAASQAACMPLDQYTPQAAFKMSASDLKALRDAYDRITAAAFIRPALIICDDNVLNAHSMQDDAGHQVIAVTAAIVHLSNGQEDELGALLAHEFGHLLHDHGEKKFEVLTASWDTEANVASRQIRQGANRRMAVYGAVSRTLETFSTFSRVAEREADDEGFSLTQKAGFSASAQRRLYQKMMASQGPLQGGYFSSHPGWGERYLYSNRLQRNEEFRRAAIASLRAKDKARFRSVVPVWVREIPDSGAAAYYEGLLALMDEQPAEDVAGLFENAVKSFYLERDAAEKLSKTAQAYQGEAGDAAVGLCVMRFRSGDKGRTVNCLERLDNEEIERFTRLTGWSDFILVGRKSFSGVSGMYSGKLADGSVALTNCKQIAEHEGLRSAYAWTVARSPAPDDVPLPDSSVMTCSRDLCDCLPYQAPKGQ